MGIPDCAPRFDIDLCRPFYDGLAADELHITACPECGTFYWYPPEVLPCHPEAHAEWKQVASTGQVYSFTTVERSLLPGADGSSVPHTIVLVEPDDAPGVRVIGLLTGDMEPACGLRVTLTPLPVGDHIVPGFAPTGQS